MLALCVVGTLEFQKPPGVDSNRVGNPSLRPGTVLGPVQDSDAVQCDAGARTNK